MNKNKFKKPESKVITKKAAKPTKIALVNAKSEDCLTIGSPKKIIPSRRASTPTRALPHSQHELSPDISQILNVASCSTSSSSTSSTSQKREKSEKLTPKTNVLSQFTPDQYKDILDVEYTKYLQAVFWKKIHEAKASKNMHELDAIEKRICKNEELLKKTTERLKNIKFNKEIDTLHALHYPGYADVLETLDKSNCEAYLSNLNDQLTHQRNQLKVKNIELPGNGAAEEFLTLITESLEDFEKFKDSQDSETPKILAQIKEINQSNQREIKRGLRNVPQVKYQIMERAAREICCKPRFLNNE